MDTEKRNLSKYPMPHNREDAIKMVRGQVMLKRNVIEQVQQAQVVCETLRQYSRQMFDHAVMQTSPPTLGRSATCDPSQFRNTDSKHCGKENDGKIRDNCRQKNSVAQTSAPVVRRPFSEPPASFIRERSRTVLDLKRTLRQRNQEFRVVSRESASEDISENRCSQSNDFMLVPIQPDVEPCPLDRDKIQVGDNEDVADDEQKCEDDIQDGTITEKEIALDGKQTTVPIDMKIEITPEAETETAQAKKPGKKSRLVRATPRSTSDASSLKSSPRSTSESSLLKPTPQTDANQGTAKNTHDTDGGSSLLTPTGKTRSKTPKKPKKRRCWVDDATVSSVASEGHPADEDGADAPDSANTGEAQPEQTTNTTPIENNMPAQCVENVDGAGTEQCQVTTEEEEPEEEAEPVLPNYLCPSSEKKSRQLAIKEWLANSSFRHASRNVPLL